MLAIKIYGIMLYHNNSIIHTSSSNSMHYFFFFFYLLLQPYHQYIYIVIIPHNTSSTLLLLTTTTTTTALLQQADRLQITKAKNIIYVYIRTIILYLWSLWSLNCIFNSCSSRGSSKIITKNAKLLLLLAVCSN